MTDHLSDIRERLTLILKEVDLMEEHLVAAKVSEVIDVLPNRTSDYAPLPRS